LGREDSGITRFGRIRALHGLGGFGHCTVLKDSGIARVSEDSGIARALEDSINNNRAFIVLEDSELLFLILYSLSRIDPMICSPVSLSKGYRWKQGGRYRAVELKRPHRSWL